MLEVNAYVDKLLSAVETHLVGSARNCEWPTEVAMPATKDPPKDVSYSTSHPHNNGNPLSICCSRSYLRLKLLFVRGIFVDSSGMQSQKCARTHVPSFLCRSGNLPTRGPTDDSDAKSSVVRESKRCGTSSHEVGSSEWGG